MISLNRIAAAVACVPAVVLMKAAADGNAGAETVLVMSGASTLASVGWFGTKTAIERRFIPIQHGPGPGTRRAPSTPAAPATGTLAQRPRTVSIHVTEEEAVDAWGEQAEQAIAAAKPAAAEGTTTLTPPLPDLPPRTAPDPYLYSDDETHIIDRIADQYLAETDAWHPAGDPAASYWTADGEDLYAHQPLPAAS